jgi:hypothetical protein
MHAPRQNASVLRQRVGTTATRAAPDLPAPELPTQIPPSHEALIGQTTLHRPQCAGSSRTSTHVPEQSSSSNAHRSSAVASAAEASPTSSPPQPTIGSSRNNEATIHFMSAPSHPVGDVSQEHLTHRPHPT